MVIREPDGVECPGFAEIVCFYYLGLSRFYILSVTRHFCVYYCILLVSFGISIWPSVLGSCN